MAAPSSCARPRYATTANAICGGGIAILYAALFAAHTICTASWASLPTFALMGLTTVTAALLALRYENMWHRGARYARRFCHSAGAIDGPGSAGLFAYIPMLDLGFLLLAVRRGWHRLALLNLVATLLMRRAGPASF